MGEMRRTIVKPKDARITKPLVAFAAMGPKLFWGREDEKWIPWDPDATDENLDCLVRDRPWPFCWGDVVWALALWDAQPTFLRWEVGFFGEIFVGSPGLLGGRLPADLLRGCVPPAVPRSAILALPPGFWHGLPPKSAP